MNNQTLSKLVTSLRAEFPGLVISKSKLRAEVKAVAQKGTLNFNFKANKPGPSETELPYLLADNDKFVTQFYKFGMAERNTATGIYSVIQRYPNPIVFADGAGGAMNLEHLEFVWAHGYLQLKKGDQVYIPSLPLDESRFVGQTQQTAATNKTSTEQGNGGVILLAEAVEYAGPDAGKTDLILPNSNALTGLQYTNQAGKEIIFILEAYGALISGGAQIATKR